MGIKITKKIDFDKIANDIQQNLKKQLEIGLIDEVAEIRRRTEAGQGVTGKRFEQYSEQYRKYRNKKGRRSGVDLTFTGAMLAALTTSVKIAGNNIIGTIFFSSAKEAQKAGFNQETRRFFGLAKEQVQRITQRLKEAIK